MISLFVDNLTNLDFSFLDPQRGLVGETLIVDAELTGELDDQGMVFDFGHIKRQLRSAIEALVDHKLVVPKHPQLKFLALGSDTGVYYGRKMGKSKKVFSSSARNQKVYVFL